jgi:RNA polymerase sigma-70 factor, ECF subfamily
LDNLDEAVERVLRGDTAAFEQIVLATSERLVRMSARIVGSVQDAEDVVQEAYVKAYGSLVAGRFDRRSSVRTWLYRIVANASIDARRSLARRAGLNDAVTGPTFTDGALVEARVALSELAGWLDVLPADQRIAMVLSAVEGLTAPEIAEVVGCSEGAVEQRLLRARAALRRRREKS